MSSVMKESAGEPGERTPLSTSDGLERSPLRVAQARLAGEGLLSEEQLAAMEEEVAAEEPVEVEAE